MSRTAVVFCLASCALSAHARADLQPTEVAIVAARGNRGSEQLSSYYAQLRKIPAENICLLDLPEGDECTYDEWIRTIRPAIQEWLDERDPDHKLRCLTTVWGVPLTIGPASSTAERTRYLEFLQGELASRYERARAAIDQCAALAPAGAVSTDVVGAGAAGNRDDADDDAAALAGGDRPRTEYEQLRVDVEFAIREAQARINHLPAGGVRETVQRQLQNIVIAIGGTSVFVQNLEQAASRQSQPTTALVAELNRLRGVASALVEANGVLEARPASIERDAAILSILDRLGGHMAVIHWLTGQLERLDLDQTTAAFDSELALVRWPQDYEPLLWQPNYLQARYADSQLRKSFPTMMVARIDAPTLALAKDMVDATIAAEEAGLAGKAYFDARGVANHGAVSDVGPENAKFDRSILAAADGVKQATTVDVVLDNEPQLFAVDACPEAALYCGWYSLGKYIDAFDWTRGAVAYHVSGGEAGNLHASGSQRWCNRLLENGVAATIGATGETEAGGFPPADEFFSHLLRGEETLAESFWSTLPRTSWSVILLGDPLYRPFKNRDVQREEAVIR